jgi:hypothetical protein
MAVTDLYVAQYLLSATVKEREPLHWVSDDSGVSRSRARGVDLELFHTHTMGWSGLCLRLKNSGHVACIEEPRPASIFERSYRQREDQQLAEVMQALADAISVQCGARLEQCTDLRESVRESLFRQVLFGRPQDQLAGIAEQAVE